MNILRVKEKFIKNVSNEKWIKHLIKIWEENKSNIDLANMYLNDVYPNLLKTIE